jgi:hypothetical protein
VLDTSFIKFSDDLSDFIILKEENEKEENDDYYFGSNHDDELIKDLKELFKSGFYFSNKYDLANSLTSQNQIKFFFQNKKMLLSNYDFIADGNKNFLSNWKLTDKVMSLQEKFRIKYYFSNCIYGNIEEFTYQKEKEHFQIIIISRRYLWNYGIYTYRKGLSKYGGNSNQIETELILIHNKNETYSNIHLSSYIPIYFKSRKNINMADANKSFVKYFQTLIDEYNVLFLFVLRNKEEDDKYISKFKNMLYKNIKSMPNKWKYYYINTKDKTIKNKFETQIQNGKNMIDYIGFNILRDTIQFDNKKHQKGILSILSTDDKYLNQNEFILIYETIYHFLEYIHQEKKIEEIFLNKNIDLNLDSFEQEKEEKKKDEIIEDSNEIKDEIKVENENENEIKEEEEENLNINENKNNIINEDINEDTKNFVKGLKNLFNKRID